MRVRTQLARGFAAALVVTALLTLSATASSARALISIEQIGVELHASNSALYAVTILEAREAASGRSTGRRQFQPWRFNYSVPSGAPTALRNWRFDDPAPQAGLVTRAEGEIPANYFRFEWSKNGVTQTCSLKVSATYRAADHTFIVRLGDLAKLADSSGKPSRERCEAQ
ncbi:MAG: hypothetical protein ABMA00_04855 [Gemmatimonas sp.]